MSTFYGTTIRPGSGEPLVIVEEGWDPRLGRTVTYEWRGRETEIRLMQLVQEGLKRKTTVRIPAFEGGEWILQATAGAGETEDKEQPLAIRWGLKKNFIEKSLWESPHIDAILEPILESAPLSGDGSDVWRTATNMKRDFDAFIRGDSKYTTISGEEADLTPEVIFGYTIALNIVAAQPILAAFLKARLKGVEVFPQWGFVLTKTVTYAEGTTQRPNKENVGKMFTKESLITAEGLDDQVIVGELPEGYWLKTPCELEQTAADKHEFVYEYWHAQTFEKFIYGEAV